jgi:hypothetical protein
VNEQFLSVAANTRMCNPKEVEELRDEDLSVFE